MNEGGRNCGTRHMMARARDQNVDSWFAGTNWCGWASVGDCNSANSWGYESMGWRTCGATGARDVGDH